MRHPVFGELELEDVFLQVADDPDQKVVTFTAGERDRERLARLCAAGRT